jgi:dynein heavy chain, axonemal
MLNQIIKHEEPKLMDKKDTAIRTLAENNKKKSELED